MRVTLEDLLLDLERRGLLTLKGDGGIWEDIFETYRRGVGETLEVATAMNDEVTQVGPCGLTALR